MHLSDFSVRHHQPGLGVDELILLESIQHSNPQLVYVATVDLRTAAQLNPRALPLEVHQIAENVHAVT
jgi:hypothetical protein